MRGRVVAAVALLLVLLGALLGLYVLGSGRLGEHWDAGTIEAEAVPERVLERRVRTQQRAAAAAGVGGAKQVLFGDLHVHSTFSTDAFFMSLPLAGGDGAHPVADACDFARHCSALDFWSINDHALALTPQRWHETVESIRHCNALSGSDARPDSVAFLGWEWTQMGTAPENHYGHKNVVLRDLEDGRIPTHPIKARLPLEGVTNVRQAAPSTLTLGMLALLRPGQTSLDVVRYLQEIGASPECPPDVPVRELPADCVDWAETPADLFAKLDEWGHESLVIPHGTTWGFYTPQGSSWEKQLAPGQHDPARQRLIEVFSGHGSAEEYRSWREVRLEEDGSRTCPEPRPDFLPSCWRAGEIVEERCLGAAEAPEECRARAAAARQHYVDADVLGSLTVPGARPEEWLDSGQCRDCFQPAFNHRVLSSVQAILALRDPASPDGAGRFGFGLLASSDNHSARPGTGYKEYARTEMTEARFARLGPVMRDARPPRDPEPFSEPVDPGAERGFFGVRETERQASFFLTGGLAAVHARGRSRDAIWDALARREVYGTSGPRILLWFDLVGSGGGRSVPMGGEARMSGAPTFVVRAVGSFEQAPGCPTAAAEGLAPERLARLCRGECYNPTDRRRRVSRIEVVRIRPQREPDEPLDGLVDDPWRVLRCDPNPAGCVATFTDHEFAASGRDALYYVRAIEEPGLAVNAGGARCSADETGRCVSVDLCLAVPDDDECLAATEERAWSSPIFVAYEAP